MRYSLASMVGMATTFFSLDIFCFMLWPLAEDEIRQLLEEKDSKNTCKKNIQSRSTCVSRIFVGKGDCRTNTEKRNCSSFKKVLEREIYSFVTMFIFSAYNVHSPSARLITLTSTLIIPHITKTSSNNCLLLLPL